MATLKIKMGGKNESWTRRILEEYFARKTDAGMDEIIQGWLVNKENKEDKDKEFEKIFLRKVKRNKRASRDTQHSLLIVQRILKFPPGKVTGMTRTLFLRYAAAAAIVVLLVTAGTLTYLRNTSINNFEGASGVAGTVEKTISVPAGEQREEILYDSSYIWVNERSSVTYLAEFTDRREVELRGEAYFEVTKDEMKPFVVRTKHLQLEVLGTKFKVAESDVDEITAVALFEGGVRVSAADGKSVVLVPGDYLEYDYTDGTFSSQKMAPGSTRDNIILGIPEYPESIVFAKATLSEIMASIERVYNVRVENIELLEEAKTNYSVHFDGDTIGDVLSVLEILDKRYTYTCDQEGSKVIINKK